MPPLGNTGIEFIQRILVNYRVLNDTIKEIIAPIGEAWIKAVKYQSWVNLWDSDDAHPSPAGSYLTASVIFSTIFDLPSKNLNFTNSMIPSEASLLRAFSDSVVFGTSFHTRYNLGGIKKLTPLYSNGQLSLSDSFAKYSWYKDKVFVSSANAITPQGNGIYNVLAQEADDCKLKSCSYSALTTGIKKEPLLETIQVFPNPVKGGLLTLKTENEVLRVELRAISGIAEKLAVEKSGAELLIFTKEIKPGCYTLMIDTKAGASYKKIIICD